MNTKICPKCGETKDVDQFYLRKTGRQKGQLVSPCKNCSKEYKQNYHLKHPERRKLQYKSWYLLHLGYHTERSHITGKNQSMKEATDSASHLGVYIAEQKVAKPILTKLFDTVVEMPYGNPGYDFLCDGLKVDVKSSSLIYRKRQSPTWNFNAINTQTDLYFCVGFNNRIDYNIIRIWLIPSASLNNIHTFTITNILESLNKWEKYEIEI